MKQNTKIIFANIGLTIFVAATFSLEYILFKGNKNFLWIVLGSTFTVCAILISMSTFCARWILSEFHTLSKTIKEEAHNINAHTEKIMLQTNQLEQSSKQQTSELRNSNKSFNNLRAGLNKANTSVSQSLDLSKKTMDSSEEGKKIMSLMSTAINNINDANKEVLEEVNKNNVQIKEILKVISDIESKTKIINDIVFQTKLLSFNASVEAARAGEHGRGFAVVAEEVGKLAQMSGSASHEISDLLSDSIQKVEHIVNQSTSNVKTLINKSVEKINEGQEISEKCTHSLIELAKNTQSMNEVITQISSATNDQSREIEDLSTVMGHFEELNQINLKNTEAINHSVAALKSEGKVLLDWATLAHYHTPKEEHEVNEGNEQNITSSTDSEQALYHLVHEAGAIEDVHPDDLANHQSTEATNVIAINVKETKVEAQSKPIKEAIVNQPIIENKMAVNGDVPSADDPRFEDV